jgi:arginyl-tRNA synthetase
MAGPISLLRELVSKAVVSAFGAEHAAADPAVKRSQFADYQADVALRLRKAIGRPPLEIAQAIADQIEQGDLFESVTVSPPGFVNFKLSRAFLERELARLAADPRVGVALASKTETVVIDYSAVNVAKEMHVGHLRSTVIGDSLARTLAFLGHQTILQNHIGDWGTPFGMLIEHLEDIGANAAAKELSVGSLNEFYQAARQKFDADPSFADRSRQRVVSLQAGDERTLALWQVLVDSSHRYFSTIYRRLAVQLTDEHARGESFYNPYLQEIALDLEQRGIAKIDDGALCVFLPEFKNREGEPLPLIVRKKDGGFGYAATDLAAIRFRARDLGATRILYVIGTPQQQHLGMVFATAKLAGYLPDSARAEHVNFGSVLGPDKKMFKTREGKSIRLAELIDEAIARAEKAVREKNPDLPEDLVARVAEQVGIGSLKYADLSSDRIKDYIFDWDRMISFEGNTGGYLQYAHARIRSIERKAEEQGVGLGAGGAPIQVIEPAERALALELFELEPVTFAVADSLAPHKLCNQLYALASSFTSFYEACPVLKAESPESRASRLALSATARRALALGLELLGIAAPDRM